MRKALFASLALMVMALAAVPALAINPGTFECMGYTITVTPTNADDPNAAGTLLITKSDEYAEVIVEGTYERDGVKKPKTTVEIWGTITTPDGEIAVEKTFTFSNGPKKAVWRNVLTFIEGLIVN